MSSRSNVMIGIINSEAIIASFIGAIITDLPVAKRDAAKP